ncbi:MAG: peptidoglycan-binding protein, partial [Angelakisella sp.]
AQARFYDAENHRFTQEDPVKDGDNWYGYVGNGPLNLVDPWGLYIFADEPGQGPTTKKDAAVKAAGSQKPVLTMGQTGDSVYDLQKKLASAGYYSHTELDGSYGPKTEAAVREFQRANGLKADGSTGPQTWTTLLGGNYVQGSDTQGRYSNQQLLNNEKKQQAATGNKTNTTTAKPPNPQGGQGNNTPIADGKFEQAQCSTYVGAVYVNSDGLPIVGHSAVMLVRDDGQAEIYSYNGNPDDLAGIVGYGALGLIWDITTPAPWSPDNYIGTRPYLSVAIDENGNETTIDLATFNGRQKTDSMVPGVTIDDKYYRGLYIPISDEQGQAMHDEARRIRENVLSGNDPGYNVTGNNCTMIAMDILGAGGIYTVGESSAHPYSFLFIPNLEYLHMENGNLFDNWGNAWYEPGRKVEGVIPMDWPEGHAP